MSPDNLPLKITIAFASLMVLLPMSLSSDVTLNPGWTSITDGKINYELEIENTFGENIDSFTIDTSNFDVTEIYINDWNYEISDKDLNGIKEFVEIDNSLLNPDETLEFTLKAENPSETGDYTWTIELINSSKTVETITNKVSIDQTPPEGSIDFPAANSNISGTVDIIGTARDSYSGSRNSFKDYKILIDNGINVQGTIEKEVIEGNLYDNWNTENIDEGEHTLSVSVTDRAGNSINSESKRIVIDNTDPVVINYTSNVSSITGESNRVKLESHVYDNLSGIENSSVKINSEPMTHGGDNYFYMEKEISQGSNEEMTLTLRDRAGNSRDKNVIIDGASPVIENFEKNSSWVKPGGKISLNFDYEEYNLVSSKIELSSSETGEVILTKTIEMGNSTFEKQERKFAGEIGIPEGIKPGNYDIKILLRDIEGKNSSLMGESGIKVDHNSPKMLEMSHSNDQVVDGIERFKLEVEDSRSGVKRAILSLGDIKKVIEGSKESYEASINTTKISDGDEVLKIFVDDKAGNRISEKLNLIVDNHPPQIERARALPTPTSDYIKIEALFKDSATDILRSELYFAGSNEKITMNSSDGSFDEREEKVEAVIRRNLQEGEHLIKIRAKDSKGHWTEFTPVEFTVNKSLDPELKIISPETLKCIQGETTSFQVKIENTGDIKSVDTNLRLNSSIKNIISPKTAYIASGDAEIFVVELKPKNDSELRSLNSSLILNSLNYAADKNVDILVEANNKTGEKIKSGLNNLTSTFQSKWNYMNELAASGMNESTTKLLKSEMEKLNTTLKDIAEFISENNYIAAKEEMESPEDSLDEIDELLKRGEKRVEEIEKDRKALFILLSIIGIVGAVLIYLLIPPKEGYDNESGFKFKPEGENPLTSKTRTLIHLISKSIEKYIGISLEKEDEEKEDGWQGYNKD